MALERPTLPTIVDRVATDIESRLEGSDARLRRSNVAVLGRALSGAVHGLYGFAVRQAEQYVITSATGSILDRWAAIWGITRKTASKASGVATFSGTAGTQIPAGTVASRADGKQYATLVVGTLSSGGTATISIQAADAGAETNAAAGTVLTVAAQVAGLNATAVVGSGGLSNGADAEGDDDLRARLVARIQDPPQGGAATDYEQWALEVADVTRAWVYPNRMGGGTVGVMFVCDNLPNIIPTQSKVDEVKAHIETVRPVTADVYVFAPASYAVNFTIHVTPDTAAVRAAVEAELKDLFARESQPEVTIYKTHYDEAISSADGETDHLVSVPAGNVVPPAGTIPMLGTITWV
ncbi:baseplate J/gp47 family protein [Pseudoxanthomonas winnipegensis]|uniref:baseplate J/gp47 family protein n=1 Tax=Pseudoxanthomonas winnipegensis TaxID=2480810 RepID=UPI00103F401F|nr:baseplate J/gp47 family protein [Pseudoxanthomonas winnipegensis]TBV76886.1 baseplate J/gp47 family protein [Pseudoxanthomonas winnipegensis]